MVTQGGKKGEGHSLANEDGFHNWKKSLLTSEGSRAYVSTISYDHSRESNRLSQGRFPLQHRITG